LQASSPDGQLLGLDVDPSAIALARQRLLVFSSRAILVQASYTTLSQQLGSLGWRAVDGIVLDLGVSSMQLDTPERGFSFQFDAPLDMRFDPASPMRAEELVNRLPEGELAELLYENGEQRAARQIARAIVAARPIHTTGQLAQVVARAIGAKNRYARRSSHPGRSSRHPATRTFQALRIAVNRELEALETVLPHAVQALAPGGRLAVISFHSLEDRIVKQYFRRESKNCLCPARQPVCTCGHQASLVEINRHPIQPEHAEIDENPRARSARLRVAEKILG
jgi:16S rRNA (cytosine1402-N4)-methyltransferase